MRSWSISVGRLFGVDVRIHLTFLILPVFIYWTDYAAHQGAASGPRDLALCGNAAQGEVTGSAGCSLMRRVVRPINEDGQNQERQMDADIHAEKAPHRDRPASH